MTSARWLGAHFELIRPEYESQVRAVFGDLPYPLAHPCRANFWKVWQSGGTRPARPAYV